MTTGYLVGQLEHLGACEDARRWIIESKFTSIKVAWEKCARPDWMLWILARMSGVPTSEARIALLSCMCDYAELEDSDEMSSRVIETVRAWLRGDLGPQHVDVLENEVIAHLQQNVAPSEAVISAYSVMEYIRVLDPEGAALLAAKVASGPKAMDVRGAIVRRYFPDPPDIWKDEP